MALSERHQMALAQRYRAAMAIPPSAGVPTARDMSHIAQALSNQGWPSTVADALILPRYSDQFIGSFGPSTPAQPTPLDVPRGDLILPRRNQYPVGYNLPSPPGAYKLIDFGTLRQLATIYDVGRRCIEIRKQEVATMEWEVTFKDPDRAKAHKTQANARARAAARGRTIATQELSEDDQAIMELEAFWDDPDPIRQLGFDGWRKMLVENILVIDAPAIFPHPTWMPGRGRLGSDLFALEILAGDTIKPLIDIRGAPPQPPQPAYQQFIWGIPRTELSQDLIDAVQRPLSSEPPAGIDREFQMPSADGRLQASQPQLYYPVYNPRDDSLYGFSNTEQIILTVNLALKRQQWWTAYFTEGSIPAGLIHAPEDWTATEMRQYEEDWNLISASEMAYKHRIRVIPGVHGFSQLKPMIGTDAGITAFDEWLARLTCIGYDVTPDEVGLQPRSGLGGGGYSAAQENVTYRKSLKPVIDWIEKICKRINISHFKRPDLVVKFMQEEAEDALKHAQEDEVLIRSGVRSQDEARQDRGLDPWPNGLGSKPMIIVRNGAVLLKDVDDMSASLTGGGARGQNLPGVAGLVAPPKSESDIKAPDEGQSGASPPRATPPGSKPASPPFSQSAKSPASALQLWRSQALRRIKGGKQALEPPYGHDLPVQTIRQVRQALEKAMTPDAVYQVFAAYLEDVA